MAMQNPRVSIESFARASFKYAIMRGWPLYFSTRNTNLKSYDGCFMNTFLEITIMSSRRSFRSAAWPMCTV
jgi:isocitrate dehydrogenase